MNPAEQLARSLDREDYPAARRLLTEDCRYEFRDTVIEGASAIIASYQNNGDKARNHFDRIEYESAIVPIDDTIARIEYTDIVTHAGESLVHRCAQEVEFDGDGAIRLIRHVDYPGEREAVEAFFERHG